MSSPSLCVSLAGQMSLPPGCGSTSAMTSTSRSLDSKRKSGWYKRILEMPSPSFFWASFPSFFSNLESWWKKRWKQGGRGWWKPLFHHLLEATISVSLMDRKVHSWVNAAFCAVFTRASILMYFKPSACSIFLFLHIASVSVFKPVGD